MYGDCLKNLHDPKLHHLLLEVVIQRLSGRYECASALKSKKEKKSLEITMWTHTNVVRSVGYGLETLCHLHLDFYIHNSNLCWIFNLGFKFNWTDVKFTSGFTQLNGQIAHRSCWSGTLKYKTLFNKHLKTECYFLFGLFQIHVHSGAISGNTFAFR